VISATNWTWHTVDELTWPELMALLDYWQDFPPVHIMVQGIASGISGQRLGRVSPKSQPKHIRNAEELIGIFAGSGIPGGVIHG
jgi:hypothetical protein